MVVVSNFFLRPGLRDFAANNDDDGELVYSSLERPAS